MEQLQLVIARYREELKWISNIQNIDRIVYNKGLDVDTVTKSVRKLPNVGREAHTYLFHIVNTWTNIAPYSAFIQGNPFDHCPNVIALLEEANTRLRAGEVLADFVPLGEYTECNGDGHPQHALPIASTWMDFTGECRNHFRFVMGAQFIASKAIIMARPLTFYINALRLVEQEDRSTTDRAYTMERLWKYIFTTSIV